jgi:hypothetical protein
LLEIAATAAVVLYLSYGWIALQRRRNQSWEDLLSGLNPGWRLLVPPNPEAIGRSHRAAQLRSLCRNAQVMQEIADYALRNFDSADRTLAEQMHCDATYLRLWAFAALVRHSLGRSV